MIILKVTEECRVDTETQAKEAMEYFRKDAVEHGYSIGSCSYTYKEKKSKGEVIDKGYLVKVVKNFGGFWE